MPIASATVLQLSGRRYSHALRETHPAAARFRARPSGLCGRAVRDSSSASSPSAEHPSKALVGFVAGRARHLRNTLIYQEARQRIEIQLDVPASSGRDARHVRHDRLIGSSRSEPWFRRQARISAIMSARSSSSTPQFLAQRRKSRRADEFETVDELLHGRIEPVVVRAARWRGIPQDCARRCRSDRMPGAVVSMLRRARTAPTAASATSRRASREIAALIDASRSAHDR